MGRIKDWFSTIQMRSGSKSIRPQKNAAAHIISNERFATRPQLQKQAERFGHELKFWGVESSHSARIHMYRFLKDAIPVLNAAIWTWTSLSASPSYFEIVGTADDELLKESDMILAELRKRIYDNRYQKFAGLESLVFEYFNTLYSTGAVAGEVILNPQRDGVDYFYFVDPASLGFEMVEGNWRIYQEQNGRKVRFELPSTYFFGLNADSVNPGGNSLLSSVPFVARVEQQLVSDMQRSMHNAGYHRIHVKITPPQKMAGESENGYIGRANSYFEEAANMFRDFSPDDNPITWDDVKIEYIGPGAKISSSNSWYINHKAMLEDICAGLHLAPFMLGYSYGTTQNWAMFKYELIQREVRSLQQAAGGFLEWLGNLELALKGLPTTCKVIFKNEVVYGLTEKLGAEKVRVETVIMKKEAGLITPEEAKRELDRE